jgi:hypothetical protein
VVNIRHWWKPDDTTNPCPTKKGVILSKNKWKQLKDTMAVMRDFVPELNDASIGCTEDQNVCFFRLLLTSFHSKIDKKNWVSCDSRSSNINHLDRLSVTPFLVGYS